MSVLKKLASDTALYGLSSIVGRTLNYLLVPLYTGLFVASEYGIYSELYSYVAFLNIIYLYGMETTFFRFAKKENYQQTFNQILTSLLMSTTLFSVMLILFSENIATLLGYSQKGYYISWLAWVIAVDTLVAIPFAKLRLQGKAKKFAFTKIASIVLNIFFNILFLLILQKVEIGYVFLSNLLANAVQILILYRDFFRFRPRFDWKTFKPMLLYALPLIFSGLAGMINEVLDRLLLKYYLPTGFYENQDNLGAVGVYAACYKLAIFMTLAVQAFKYGAEPFFFAQAENKQAPALFARVMRYFVILSVVIWVGVSVYTDVLKYIFLRQIEYHEGIVVVPILLLANLFLGIYYNLTVWFKITDRTIFGTWISLIGAGVTLATNLALIPVLGYMGSALATLLAYFTMAVLCYLWGQKYFPIPYNITSAIVHISIGAGIIAIVWYIPIVDVWLDVAFHTLVFLFYLALLYFMEFRNYKLKR